MDFIRGEVLYDPNFVYPDAAGQKCDKLLLVVNKNHSSPEDLVLIPAKTNIENRVFPAGCDESNRIFYFDKQIGFYREKTILQLFHIDTYTCSNYEDLIRKKRVDRLGKSTTQEEFARILNCLKKMKEDISICIQELIF